MKNVVLATIPSDSHCLNLIYIEKVLKEKGFKVFNLGCCTPIQQIENTCVTVRPAFVIISTLNGHGYMESIAISETLRKNPVTSNIPLFIGGKIGVNITKAAALAKKCHDAGFTDVFYGENQWNKFCNIFLDKVVISNCKARLHSDLYTHDMEINDSYLESHYL